MEWKAGDYLRLSDEDKNKLNKKDDSNSIKSQRLLGKDFEKRNEDIKIVKEYVDDGFTGTDFNRDGFQQMLRDIIAGVINCVIVKDLSRLGRDYIEVGNYIQCIFPLYNVRFISINDKIDSYLDSDSINNVEVAFKNLMNDEYSRDISKKVRSHLVVKKENGEFCGNAASYGYIRDPKDRHHLIVDLEASIVVQKIFGLYIDGKGTESIAKQLNELGILCPCEYKKQKYNIYCGNGNKNRKGENYWSSQGVSQILKNRVYCGDLVQGKTKRISHKIHKKVKIPKEQWIIKENTHEAIIDRDTYNKVQEEFKLRDVRIDMSGDNQGNLSLFSGFLKCNDCYRSMNKYTTRSKTYEEEHGHKKAIYYCSTYSRKSHTLCTKHSMDGDLLEELVLKSIKNQIQLVIDLDNAINVISKSKNTNVEKEMLKSNINKTESELDKLRKLKRICYDDWKLDVITEDEYNDYSNDYTKEIAILTEKLTKMNSELSRLDITKEKNNQWIEEFKKEQNITQLTRKVLISLVKNIYIKENNNIKIEFKYEDEFNKTIEYVKNNEFVV